VQVDLSSCKTSL